MPKRRAAARKKKNSSNVVSKKRKTRKRGKTKKKKVVSKPPSNPTKENVLIELYFDVALSEEKKLEHPSTPTKENILAFLKSNIDKESMEKSPDDTDDPRIEKFWTVADLFIRQYLNNACDGFGMENVEEIFQYLVTVKKELVDFKLISKDGFNNSGFSLWKDYDFEPDAARSRSLNVAAAMGSKLNVLIGNIAASQRQ